MSLSARRAWIEIIEDFDPSSTRKSLSARRAWIEIIEDFDPSSTRKVALRKESVDRNSCYLDNIEISEAVALRKESVDRNKSAEPSGQAQCVALRKESVDRNTTYSPPLKCRYSRSPQGERG